MGNGRLHKYRAWHPEWPEMIYSATGYDWFGKREFYPFKFDVGFSNYPKDDRWVIMESTGLFDQTQYQELTPEEQQAWLDVTQGRENWVGREIFRDDIIDCSYINPMSKGLVICRYVITWGCGGFEAKWWKDNEPGLDREIMFVYKRCKVIGNIYFNPELLEVR